MAFPALNGTTFPFTLDAAWAGARNTAAQIKAQCTALNAQIAAGPVSSQVIINNLSFFATLNTQLTAYAAVPGLAAYAQQQVNNPSLDVAGAFTTMQAALVATGNWIVTNFPTDSSGFLQATQFSNGQVQWANFTSAQLAGLVTQLNALSATIS
jgi:hypothetical protein